MDNPRSDLSVLSIEQKSQLKQNYIQFWAIIAGAVFLLLIMAYFFLRYLPVFYLFSNLVQLATLVAVHHNSKKADDIKHGRNS
jgi:hypothetical protein